MQYRLNDSQGKQIAIVEASRDVEAYYQGMHKHVSFGGTLHHVQPLSESGRTGAPIRLQEDGRTGSVVSNRLKRSGSGQGSAESRYQTALRESRNRSLTEAEYKQLEESLDAAIKGLSERDAKPLDLPDWFVDESRQLAELHEAAQREAAERQPAESAESGAELDAKLTEALRGL